MENVVVYLLLRLQFLIRLMIYQHINYHMLVSQARQGIGLLCAPLVQEVFLEYR
jgi:hypothetical protein